jgi:hypothetical protein
MWFNGERWYGGHTHSLGSVAFATSLLCAVGARSFCQGLRGVPSVFGRISHAVWWGGWGACCWCVPTISVVVVADHDAYTHLSLSTHTLDLPTPYRSTYSLSIYLLPIDHSFNQSQSINHFFSRPLLLLFFFLGARACMCVCVCVCTRAHFTGELGVLRSIISTWLGDCVWQCSFRPPVHCRAVPRCDYRLSASTAGAPAKSPDL